MATSSRFLHHIRLSPSGLCSTLFAPSVSLGTGSQYQQCMRWCSTATYNNEYYSKLVIGSPVVVFMKGTPSAPMCGFSRLVVQILHMHGLESFNHHNVLEDVDFKEGMKEFSKWPTFPQVYMNGELVGGADIMLQMHQSGELVEELQKVGHKSVLLDEDKKE